MQTKNMILLLLTLFSFAAAMKSGFFADIDKKPAEVTGARVSADASVGANWMINGRTHDSTHFSPLKTVGDKNVNQLGLNGTWTSRDRWAWFPSRSWLTALPT
jgi:glucose dehydrogenase